MKNINKAKLAAIVTASIDDIYHTIVTVCNGNPDDEEYEALMTQYDLTVDEAVRLVHILNALDYDINAAAVKAADTAASETVIRIDPDDGDTLYHDIFASVSDSVRATIREHLAEIVVSKL
jgi:hypothetical protein